MSMRRGWLAGCVAACLAQAAMAAGGVWLTDFDAGKAQAAAEKKSMLVDFSGSDWCGWCIKLDQEVFSQDAFIKEATNQYVLVVLDFPRDEAKIPAEQRQKNEALAKQLGVQGFPTVFVCDADGKVLAQTGYRPGGPEAYLKHLAALLGGKETLKKLQEAAAAASGVEKAKLLEQILKLAEEGIDIGNPEPIAKEIIALDANNEAGLRNKYQLRVGLTEAMQAVEKRDLDGASKLFDRLLEDLKPTGEDLQQVQFMRGGIFHERKDLDGVLTCLRAALDAAPESDMAPRIKAMIERFSREKERAAAAKEEPAAKPAETPAPVTVEPK